jgi:hypothetical protein
MIVDDAIGAFYVCDPTEYAGMTARRRATGTSRQKTTGSPRHSGDGLQRRAVKEPIDRIDIPDEVLNRVTELAGIRPGIGWWGPHKKFASDVVNTVRKVHALGLWATAGYLGMSVEQLERTYGQHHGDHLKSARDAADRRPHAEGEQKAIRPSFALQ